ncbi:Golgi transport complex subunit 6 [Sporothrix bragantina]|uniref:Conserved oligomeric Golgi complex subunit 6 n=1 Tax=Sporothrix bragantina TaxID=671064 RepID=A0ABP0CQ37_9PEZI
MASEAPHPLQLGSLDSLGVPSRTDVSGTALLSPRTPTSASALKGSNPLTSKVTSVLSASYTDADFRDSLALLDERNTRNNAETRRRLRLDVQKEVIDTNGEVIADFGRVAEQLRRIGSTIEKLNKTYDAMKTEIAVAHSATEPVLEEASTLIDKRRNVDTRRKLLGAFVNHFVLSDDEIAILAQTAEPMDNRFFAVLNKAKKILKDCEVLLGFEENPSLGSEVMTQTSKNINNGYQKLYKWVQREFKNLNLENPQIGSAMSRALRVLAERPSLFQSCLDAFAEARESILSDAFYVALTGSDEAGVKGGSNNRGQSVKPIEMAAHDPLRYAGDMLAWTHSATVSEREALESLFIADGDELARGLREGRENDVWHLVEKEDDAGSEAFDPVKALNELVDRDLSGVARLLRQRMQQVVQANEDTILAFKLANLLNFYRLTFAKLLSGNRKASGSTEGDESSLVETLNGLETEALRHFRSLVRDHVSTLQTEFSHAPADSAQPDFLRDGLEQLVAIMKTYDTSLASPDSREPGFVPILAEALDPYLAGCEEMAKKAASAVDSLIFMMNCLMATRETLSAYDFTTTRVLELQSSIDAKAAAIVDNQYGFFCEQSSVEALFAALTPLAADNKADLQKAIKLDLLQPQVLTLCSQRLDDFLPSALMDAVENLKPLQDTRLARQLTEEAAEKFCVNFEHVEAILDAADEMLLEEDENKDPETTLRSLFPRTTVEIRVLLS